MCVGGETNKQTNNQSVAMTIVPMLPMLTLMTITVMLVLLLGCDCWWLWGHAALASCSD
jgi:hypothetical protein